MKWILTLLIFTSWAFLIVGDRLSELIRHSYVNRTNEICRIYSYFEENGFKIDELDVCDILMSTVIVLTSVNTSGDYYTIAKIKRGTFNNNEGFVLILDDLSEIDIPAMIQCELKDKNGKDVPSHGKAIVYYAVVYMEEEKIRLNRAMPSGKFNERNMTEFLLQGAFATHEYKETYNERNARKYVERWFEKNEENGKKKCEQWSKEGILNEKQGVPWKVIDGEVISSVEKRSNKKKRKQKPNKTKTSDFYLRLTDNIEYKLIGIIKCKVKSQLSSSQNITEKYFTVTYVNREEDIGILLGPISIDGKQLFVIGRHMYDMLNEQSLSITRTKI